MHLIQRTLSITSHPPFQTHGISMLPLMHEGMLKGASYRVIGTI